MTDTEYTAVYSARAWTKKVVDFRVFDLPVRIEQFRKSFMSDLTDEQAVFVKTVRLFVTHSSYFGNR